MDLRHDTTIHAIMEYLVLSQTFWNMDLLARL